MARTLDIRISENNYRKLLVVMEEGRYESIDEVLEDALDFWLTFKELSEEGKDDDSRR